MKLAMVALLAAQLLGQIQGPAVAKPNEGTSRLMTFDKPYDRVNDLLLVVAKLAKQVEQLSKRVAELEAKEKAHAALAGGTTGPAAMDFNGKFESRGDDSYVCGPPSRSSSSTACPNRLARRPIISGASVKNI